MTTAVQSAHQAYRAAAELAPDRNVVRVDFARRPQVGDQSFLAWANREIEVEARHLVAAGGGVLAFIAGAACGAYLYIG